ncbi:hypothetical protein O181_059469 [Austropuccinia psidii MF-1]|uniref:Uncharacterized protein n=1 Tax=Austropuccinia psidii MF-1 TaxID=1389203 RepID=A0A9Q3EEF1_9BASI|nr:hypothetical protein [Austropuccinia psidii MF-1]
MSSWFSVEPPTSATPSSPQSPSNSLGSNLIHPVSSRYGPDSLFGTLSDQDTAWLAQSTGFVTETQTFYITIPGGKLAMCQVIHSAIGLWYPQIQFTFRFYDSISKKHVWKSTNVTNFKTPPIFSNSSDLPKYDKRSCKSDQFSILLDPNQPDTYSITGKHDDSIHFQFNLTRMDGVPGWKLGHDARGGFTYFGRGNQKRESPKSGPDYSASTDGYIIHRFWPRCSLSGQIILNGQPVNLNQSRAIFIHAVQGMRPNLIASRWNFCNFQSVQDQTQPDSTDPGVSLTLMEFTTVPGSYGPPQIISVGSIVLGDKLIGLSCDPNPNEAVQAKTTHQTPLLFDNDTGYQLPSLIKFQWTAPVLHSALAPSALSNVSSQNNPNANSLKAEILLDLDAQNLSEKESYVTRGLVEKVDVLAQIPYLVKKVVAAVAGTRPYIYTWFNPVSGKITLPKDLVTFDDKLKESETEDSNQLVINGYLFNEATFISDL